MIADKHTSKFIDTFERGDFVDKTQCNKDGRTFLGEAVMKGAEGIMLYLMKDKELAELEDKNGKLFFFYLDRPQNKKRLIAQLAKENFDFSQKSSDGRGVLHSFAPMDNGELFTVLKKLGADPDAKDQRNESAMDVAKRYRNINVINLSDVPTQIFK